MHALSCPLTVAPAGSCEGTLRFPPRGTPDKPRDIWKCQSDKYGSCVVVMQPLPRSRRPLCLVCLSRVVVLPRLSSLSNPTLPPLPPPLRAFAPCSHGESVAPAGDRFAPGMKVLSRLERYREVGTSLWRILAKWQLSIVKNRDTKSESGRFVTVNQSHFYLSRCA